MAIRLCCKAPQVMRIDASGDIGGLRSYGSGGDTFISVRAMIDGTVLAAGYTLYPGLPEEDAWIVRMGSDGFVSETCPPRWAPRYR